MDVFEAVQRRHSVRAYDSASVPKDKLMRILEAARLRLLLETFNHGIL